MRSRRKRDMKILAVLLLVCIGIGYAALNANLKIDGVVNMPTSSWDVHFANVQISSGSVALSTGDTAATIVTGQTNKVSYKVSFHNPGDYYEFTVDAVNAGTVDAMIDTISSKLNNAEITSSNLPAYLNYSVTYADGIELATKHKLAAGATEKYRIRVEYKSDIEASELPQGETLSLNFQVDYVQTNSTAIDKPMPDFATAPWDTITTAYNSGDTEWLQDALDNGTMKEVDLGTFGKHYVRIANLSTPSECSTEGFSQTACGFVIEFADVITTHQMNLYNNSGNTNGDGNKGGWEYSDMRAFLNSTTYVAGGTNYSTIGIYNALPSELRNEIVATKVISGYGINDNENFITTDNIYLLSTQEVWGNNISYDTANNNTRQLDHYRIKGVSLSNCSETIKKNSSDSASYWWLRTARSDGVLYFASVSSTGSSYGNGISYNTHGVSPAFRIG